MFSQIFFIFLLLCALFCAFHISRSDFRRRIIPDVYLFPLMLTGLILISFYNWPIDISGATIGATFGYFISAFTGFLFDSYLRKHNPDAVAPIGMGDIKLIGIGGLWLGTTGLSIALIIACLTGGLWARIKHQRYIPFAPFFILGGILSLIGVTFLL